MSSRLFNDIKATQGKEAAMDIEEILAIEYECLEEASQSEAMVSYANGTNLFLRELLKKGAISVDTYVIGIAITGGVEAIVLTMTGEQ